MAFLPSTKIKLSFAAKGHGPYLVNFCYGWLFVRLFVWRQGLALWPRLALSFQSSCLNLLNSWDTGMHHYTLLYI
jgi:hypothetical protein